MSGVATPLISTANAHQTARRGILIASSSGEDVTSGEDANKEIAGLPGLGTFLAIAAVIASILLVFVLRATGGTFGFSLDDPYIHLTLASHILDGHYGINPNEAAAPSSSILFPFLVAALLKLGGGPVTILLVNLFFTGVTIFLITVLISDLGIDLSRVPSWRVLIAALALLLGLNLVGIAFTGLEHPIHIADTLACFLGIVRTIRTGRMPWWLPVVLVLEPLIRFEGLAVWVAGIIVLWKHKRAVALLTFATGLILVATYSFYLHHLGLPLLPSSVMAKSTVAGSVGSTAAFARAMSNLLQNLKEYGAPQLLAMLALLAMAFFHNRAARGIVLFAALPIVAHLVAGAFGWFGRYEIYVLTLGSAAVLVLYTDTISGWLTGSLRVFAVGILIWLAVQDGYVRTTVLTPRAAHEIYLQQFQMHRFATEFWHKPVAVNDLGWVAYGNPNYVLDLWGLGSEAARVARAKAGSDTTWMGRLVQQHHVDLVMIYTSWFPRQPTDWIEVATLKLDRKTVAARDRTVTFFATTPASLAELEDALARFAPTLPSGVTLTRIAHHALVAPEVGPGGVAPADSAGER
jgi:hypothetical protein